MLRGALKVAFLAAVVYFVFDLYVKLGFTKHFWKHYPGQCRQVKGLDFGAEDLDVTTSGQAFITSGLSYLPMSDSYKQFLRTNNIRGRIFLYDFNTPDAGAIELKIKGNFDTSTFRPHGLSLLEDKIKGEHLIYVINHAETQEGNDRVEKFRFLPQTKELLYVKSFTSDAFYITNDLAVTEEDQFYISNYLYFHNHLLSTFEQSPFMISMGALLFFNGTHSSEVVPSLLSPNGVTLSKDQRYLYVNLPLEGACRVYERNKDNNSLSLAQEVDLQTSADNFFTPPSGHVLYTGSHPIGFKILDHLLDPVNQSPSQVLRIPLKNGRIVEEEITEVFYDHGDLISASTIAATYNNKLIIGSIIDKLVVCDNTYITN